MARLLTRGVFAASVGLVVAAALAYPANSAATGAEGRVVDKAKHPVAGQYVVFLKEGPQTRSAGAISDVSGNLAGRYGGKLRSVWDTAVHGFSVTSLNKGEAARLAADPRVAQVRQAGTARALDDQLNPPSWGMDRVDQRKLPLDKKYTYNVTAASVNVYVTDTGIKYGHEQFEGRAKPGADFIGDGRNGEDCSGHGTHVSGTIGGKTVGLAKKVNLFSVRMLGVNCGNSAPDSAGIDALNWVAKNGVKPAVVNMSWTFDDAAIGDDALKAVDAAGITLVSAAGNAGSDGCSTGPGARLPAIINVGMTDSNDARNGISNYGRCLDLFAPGGNIYSATSSGTTSYGNMTGTSMASPHVAGTVALYLEGNPNATPAQAHAYVVDNSTPDVVTNAGSGSPNKLLYILGSGTPPPPPGNDFSIAVNPTSLTVKQGAYGSASVSTTVTGGTAETVALSATGLPTGATATFQPSSVTAGEQAKLSIEVASSTTPGSYPVKIVGKAASATHDTTLTLVVSDPSGGNDFSMALNPTSGTVKPGESASSTLSTTLISGDAEKISLSVSGAPNGVTASINPDTIAAGESAKLSITTTSSVADGAYSIVVKGAAASATHEATFSLTIKSDTPPPPTSGIANGGFETGTLNGWTVTGTAGVTSPGRTGSYAAKIGGTSGTSTISQTFTVPTGKSWFSVYTWQSGCPWNFGDLTSVILVDNTTGFSRTLSQNYCQNSSFWWQVSGGVTAGHSYTLTIKHANTSGTSTVKADDAVLT